MRKEDLSIIVVDDLQFSREVVKSGLGKSGFSDIRTASSADEAMYLLNQRRAHVVLADFWMPGMNGLEMTDLIRRWDENNDRYTGIVLLTAEDTASSIVVAFDRGVDDFVSKSANQFELAARVYGAGRNAYQQNELRERMRRVGNRFLRVKQSSLQDPETSLPNRAQLELHIESLIEHCKTRGGGLGVGLIEVKSSNNELRLGTLKTIANSIQLSLRPVDMVSRFNLNTFAVSVQYANPQEFNPDLFDRLIESIKRHTMQTTDQGKQLHISIGVWHGHDLDPAPSVSEIIGYARKASAPIQ
ncbi:MAG: response regulator [Gammaproteobacteria bacterium]|nr:MAG: response regulator [Gammaproteobacteria bacterium]UCH41781.1 MAG: response regulator [Gammaproteobacteria bacterium]